MFLRFLMSAAEDEKNNQFWVCPAHWKCDLISTRRFFLFPLAFHCLEFLLV